MKLYKNSLSLQILEYLMPRGAIQRKLLYTPFSSCQYNNYTIVVRRLLEEGYIEQVRKNRLNCIQITQEGISALTSKKQSSDDVCFDKNKKASGAKAKKRQALVAGVTGLCMANGFLIEKNKKPDLQSLYNTHNPIPEGEKNAFESKLKDGIFYSTGEIRAALTNLFGNNEISNWTRMVGIVMYRGYLSFVYSVSGELIKWVVSNEEKSVGTIVKFLMSSPVLQRALRFYVKPNCIVCGKGYAMIPKIVYGRKWGRIVDSKSDTFRRLIARDHINSHNLGKVFGAAYYVTYDRRGVDDFDLACLMDDRKAEEICDRWFESLDTATRIKTYAYWQGLTNKRERVVYMPYMDLIALEFFKKQNIPCHFVVPKNTQEAVSRVMGPLILSIRSLSGEKLKYNPYDEMGSKISLGTQ